MPAEVHSLFPAAGKVSKTAVAAPTAMNGSARAWLLQTAPAGANKKQNGDSVVGLRNVPDTSGCRGACLRHAVKPTKEKAISTKQKDVFAVLKKEPDIKSKAA
ncbi:MAG: hypothetical protein V4721_01375 [Bacteroidota bacterium]